MFSRELPTSLDGLIDLALRVDSRLEQRDQRDRQSWPVTQDYRPIESGPTVSHRPDSEPCRLVELGFPGRRENADAGQDYVFTVVRRDISW